jgi:hypothetical protein
MLNSAIVLTANDYMNALAEVFGEQMVRQGSLPARSSDLNPRNFYFWVTLKYRVFACV